MNTIKLIAKLCCCGLCGGVSYYRLPNGPDVPFICERFIHRQLGETPPKILVTYSCEDFEGATKASISSNFLSCVVDNLDYTTTVQLGNFLEQFFYPNAEIENIIYFKITPIA